MDIEKDSNREAFESWFESLNKNGRTTYFLGQESTVAWEAWQAAKEHEANKLGQEILTHERLQELIAIGVKAALDEREQK